MAPRPMQLFKQYRFLVMLDQDVIPCALVYQDPFLDAVVIRAPHIEERDPHLMGRLKERAQVKVYLLGGSVARPITIDYDPKRAKYAPLDLDMAQEANAMQTIYLMGAKTNVQDDVLYTDESLPEIICQHRLR